MGKKYNNERYENKDSIYKLLQNCSVHYFFMFNTIENEFYVTLKSTKIYRNSDKKVENSMHYNYYNVDSVNLTIVARYLH